jgi:hypothetical protein
LPSLYFCVIVSTVRNIFKILGVTRKT